MRKIASIFFLGIFVLTGVAPAIALSSTEVVELNTAPIALPTPLLETNRTDPELKGLRLPQIMAVTGGGVIST